MTHVITLDWESYFDDKYTLKEMTTAQYIRDSRFQEYGFGISLDLQPARWYTGSRKQLAGALAKYPIEDSILVAHNAIFDGAILEWLYDRHPKQYFCTMMGSRPYVAPWTGRMDLRTVAEFLEVGVKGDELKRSKGKRLEDFTGEDLLRMSVYCCGDVALSMRAFAKLWKWMPQDERTLLDLTIKKFTRPRLHLNRDAITARLDQVQLQKATALLAMPAGVTKADLMSNNKFALVLERFGVAPPRKISKTTGQPTFAFAKLDEGLSALRGHPDQEVRNLIEARLLWKSSQEETRLERFVELIKLHPALAVPLLYYGAHTGRMSGYDSLNLQNLPRPKKGIVGLRHCLVAPPGYEVVTVDLSQIEARIVATLAGQGDLLKLFATGGDPYSAFATLAYGYQVLKASHPIERFVGKTCILGLGYGMGAARLLATLLAQATQQGISLSLKQADSERFVSTYRSTYAKIPGLWRRLNNVLRTMCETPEGMVHSWGPLKIHRHRIELPNGMFIHYPELQIEADNRSFSFMAVVGTKLMRTSIWGGTVLENVSQALARIIISTAEIRLAKVGLPSVLQVHDELVFVVKQTAVPGVKQVLTKVLGMPVPWLPLLPLACEVGAGPSYGDAK